MIINIKKILACAFAVALLLSVVCCLINGNYFAHATESPSAKTELFLPKTELEYKDLKSPISAYSDESVTAIVENSQDYHVLTVFTENGYYDTSATSDKGNLLGVRKFNDEYLLYANASDLFAISVNDFSVQEVNFDDKKGVSSFDVAGNYLVTALNTEMALYEINGDFTTRLLIPKTIKDRSPVAINENGDVFIVCKAQNGEFYLSKFSVNDTLTKSPQNLAIVSPTHMIANNDYVYYLEAGEVFRISIDGGAPQKLTVAGSNDYDLGNLKTPSGISFKGNNLLITDTTLNAVQEFRVEGDNLVFTGFAIAKDKTAYNRISKSVSKIEKYGDKVATLDGKKLSVVTVTDSFDAYDKQCFKDYFSADFGGKMPSSFALGSNTALLSFVDDINTNFGSLKLLDLSNGKINEVEGFESTTIIDLTYQSGYYYVLVAKGTSYKVYSACEKDKDFTFTETEIPANGDSKIITVDVFKNIYVANTTSNKISKYALSDGALIDEYAYQGTIKEILTDLGGGLFALKENSVLYLDKDNQFKEITLKSQSLNENAKATSFAMDFIDNNVYVVYQNEEFVYKTTELSNLAITDLTVPATYVTTSSNAYVENFKAYTPKVGANVYSITKTENGFSFGEIISEQKIYALICEIVQVDLFDRQICLYALAGQDGVVLVNAIECESVNVRMTEAPEKAFVTTAVHAYFLPISTPDDGYALTNESKIRLPKETLINPTKTFTFLGCSYYYATTVIDGVTYSGYVPTNFTVEILSENFEWNSYTVKTVNKTDVFAEKELQNSIGTLADGQQIRLIESYGETVKLAYQTENGWVIGYVKATSIQKPANVAIRNILIILAATACVCGTTSYFLLRRKV